MKKLVAFSILAVLGMLSLNAGVAHGKKVYLTKLKEPCGFTGDEMGIKYTSKEWEKFYQDGELNLIIKQECPKSKIIGDKKELESLYKFFVMFSKDSGNKPSCAKE